MEATGSVLQGPYSEGQASSSLLITTRLLGRNWRSERRKCSRVAVRLRSQIQHFPLPPARIRSGSRIFSGSQGVVQGVTIMPVLSQARTRSRRCSDQGGKEIHLIGGAIQHFLEGLEKHIRRTGHFHFQSHTLAQGPHLQ